VSADDCWQATESKERVTKLMTLYGAEYNHDTLQQSGAPVEQSSGYVSSIIVFIHRHRAVHNALMLCYLSLTSHPGQLSLAIPSWVGSVSTCQRAVMLCDWGVKADMVLFAGNTV